MPSELAGAARYLRRMTLAYTLLGDGQRAAIWRAAARSLAAGPPGRLAPEVVAGLQRLERGGSAPDLEALLMQIPPGLFDLLAVSGLGPRRVRTLWDSGHIATLGQLERACTRGRVAALPGFDAAAEERILASLRRRRLGHGRWLRPAASARAQEREEVFARTKGLLAIERAGRMRRAWEVVEELVWVAAAEDPPVVLGRLATLSGAVYPDPATPDTLRFAHRDAPPERLVVVDASRFASRLFLETGSAGHVRGVLARLDAGVPGRAPGADPTAADTWLPRTEAEIYARAGLDFVVPELREGRGEIAAARAGRLPRLIETGDLRGALHVHTQWSDGRHSIAEIAAAAGGLGWSYVGIADHSRSAFYARGLDADRLAAQAEELQRVQEQFPAVRLFHGIECDILPGGELDLPAPVLARLDFVIASIHTPTGEDRAAMTRRVVAALRRPETTLLAHPSGRLLLEREGHPLDWDALLDAAAESGAGIEFNARPERLDLDWRLLREATGRGISICVNPDAHSCGGLRAVVDNLATARKGWLTAEQVLNTRDVDPMEAHFRARRARAAGSGPGGPTAPAP